MVGEVTHSVMFLVSRKRDEYDRGQELLNQIADRDAQIEQIKLTLTEAEKGLREKKDEKRRLEAQLAEATEKASGLEKELKESRETIRKIRTHFGDREMKAALAIVTLEEAKTS